MTTTDGGSAGTAGANYKTDPPAPKPRAGDDATEPGRRRDKAEQGRQR